MKAEDLFVTLHSSGATIGKAINENETEEARAALAAAIGIITLYISDSLWERMMEEAGTPCGVPECKCHLTTEPLMKALDQIRKESLTIKNKEEPPQQI